MSLWTLLPAAASLVGTIANKPRKKDYQYDTEYLDKYINNLRGQAYDRRVQHMIMQPALRQIGQQTQRGQRSVEQFVARNKPGGGVEAQMRLGLNQQALSEISKAGELAFREQYKESRRIGEKVEDIRLQRGQLEAQGKRSYNLAKRQWGGQLLQSGLSLAAGIGSEIASTVKANTEIMDKAKSLNLVEDDTSLKDFKQMAANAGFETLGEYVNQMAGNQRKKQALNVFTEGNIPTDSAIDEMVKLDEITPEYGRELKIKAAKARTEVDRFKAASAIDPEEVTEDEIIQAVEEGDLSTKQGQEFIEILDYKKREDEFVDNYSDLVFGLDQSREESPDDFSGRIKRISSADLPGKDRMRLLEEEIKFSNDKLTSFQKSVYESYFDRSEPAENMLKHMDKKGVTKKEATLIASLYKDKLTTEKEATPERKQLGEAVATSTIVRNTLINNQGHLSSNESFKYLDKILNVRTLSDLEELGGNLAAVQAHVHQVALKANIPATLPGYSEAYGTSFSQEQMDVFDNMNAQEKRAFLKQKFERDMMSDVFKALKAAEFPGVLNPETMLNAPEDWQGVPTTAGGATLTEFVEPLTELDLSKWE